MSDRERCSWPGAAVNMIAYHDDEWGEPERDDRALFEKLLLDGFQAGLSWSTILNKRANFRAAFDGFDPAVIAGYGEEKHAALMQDAGIIRNRAKITAAIASARAYLDIQASGKRFSDVIWQFTDGRTIHTHVTKDSAVAVDSAASKAMAKELKRLGFKFCGPTICYAFMQAVGIVNDHLVTCYRYQELIDADHIAKEGRP